LTLNYSFFSYLPGTSIAGTCFFASAIAETTLTRSIRNTSLIFVTTQVFRLKAEG
jgi:hypothetical protein